MPDPTTICTVVHAASAVPTSWPRLSIEDEFALWLFAQVALPILRQLLETATAPAVTAARSNSQTPSFSGGFTLTGFCPRFGGSPILINNWANPWFHPETRRALPPRSGHGICGYAASGSVAGV